MLNRLASLTMSTSILKALPGKLDIKRHSPSILHIKWPEDMILELVSYMYVQNPNLNANADISSGAKSIHFGLSLLLLPYFVYVR